MMGVGSNQPVMGIVQDSLLGAQKITQRDVFIERDVFLHSLQHYIAMIIQIASQLYLVLHTWKPLTQCLN
jgi:hypothetical protein